MKKNRRNTVSSSPLSTMPPEDMFVPQSTLDFHKLDPMMHYDIEKTIVDFIEECYCRGLFRIVIITGKGAVIHPMAQKLLKRSHYIKEFRFAGYFTGQNGAIEILLNEVNPK